MNVTLHLNARMRWFTRVAAGYVGRDEVTIISDGAEIMKRLPKALPIPTAHIIDWFHIAMKIQPMQQSANHIVRWRDEWTNETVVLDEEIRALKWKLWHGQVDRAMRQLEELIADIAPDAYGNWSKLS